VTIYIVPEVFFGRQCPIVDITEGLRLATVLETVSGIAVEVTKMRTDRVDGHATFVVKYRV